MKTKKKHTNAQNTSFDVFWVLFPSPGSWVVVHDMGIASCRIVPKYVVIAVCKKLVKTQINTISALKLVKAISQEILAQMS